MSSLFSGLMTGFFTSFFLLIILSLYFFICLSAFPSLHLLMSTSLLLLTPPELAVHLLLLELQLYVYTSLRLV
ncbi:membrane protein [Candidatus Magnetoovum chiemensis]|nr:membrane protein [Candidatus Magnetoovum chiemensis]KJR43078.1 membrane protein [Candidatus Magnetoovum chiemensis]